VKKMAITNAARIEKKQLRSWRSKREILLTKKKLKNMKLLLMALFATTFAYTGVQAQTKQTTCPPTAAQPKTAAPKTAVKPKSAVRTTTKTTTTTLACRMLPYQVCAINPDRRSVSCYSTTDPDHKQQEGSTITTYGPTGPMPGEAVRFKVRTIVVKGQDKGSFCVRNEANNTTVCNQPGILMRDANGYYSYGEAVPKNTVKRITAK
jgi:hypothetical protein